ncbi:hypothetical protein Lser_V15G06317 [Lactuca serriola]
MDEEGTQYHARVFNQNFSRFRHLLKEDESYIVIKANMAAVTNGFSYTSHKQTLTLDWKSILKKCDDFSGPINGFMFVDFNSIIEQTCPRDTFFDVIGQIVSFSPLEISNPVESKHYIKLTLSNLDSVHLKVTIFGSQTYQMSQYLKNNPTVNCAVIVMQFLKLNIWNDIGEAKSHFEVTKLFINSDIYEINEFKNKLKCHDNFDDFNGNFPLKTVCEITEPIKEMKFLLVASIVNIMLNLPWYIIPINVQDCTGTIGLTLFDKEAKRLLNISAYELKKIHEARPETVMDYFQLYVALSRVQGREGLKLLILDKDDKLTNKTFNVVYEEVFRNL